MVSRFSAARAMASSGISIILTTLSEARTRGPDGGSCVSSWGPAANCCCRAITVDSTGFLSLMRSRLRRSRDSPSTAPTACGRCARAIWPPGRIIQQGASAKLAVRLNGTTTVTSLTAYRKSDTHFFIDPDATELPVATADAPGVQRQVSQELTLAQRTPRLTWIAGVFLFDDNDDAQIEITQYGPRIQIRPFSTVDARAWALFSQATYSLSSRVSLTGGVRYSDEQKDIHNIGGRYQLGTAVLANPASFYDFVDRATYDAWTPKASIQFQASPETFVYFSATRGFKSGGLNVTATAPGGAFQPEFAWSYEGGLKRTMADGRVYVNTAVFYNDYKDLQVQTFVRPGVIDISNAGISDHKWARARGDRGGGARPAPRGPGLVARRDLRPLPCRRARRCDGRRGGPPPEQRA